MNNREKELTHIIKSILNGVDNDKVEVILDYVQKYTRHTAIEYIYEKCLEQAGTTVRFPFRSSKIDSNTLLPKTEVSYIEVINPRYLQGDD